MTKVFTSGISFAGRAYEALRKLERGYPEMARSEIIGRALILACLVQEEDGVIDMINDDPDLLACRALDPRLECGGDQRGEA